MENSENMRTYLPIEACRLLNIRVILDGENVYEGMVDDAPEEIRKLKYSKVEIGDKNTFYVFSKLQ